MRINKVKRTITIKDVAKQAGVSISTVTGFESFITLDTVDIETKGLRCYKRNRVHS